MVITLRAVGKLDSIKAITPGGTALLYLNLTSAHDKICFFSILVRLSICLTVSFPQMITSYSHGAGLEKARTTDPAYFR